MRYSVISNRSVPVGEAIQGLDIRKNIFDFIQSQHPAFTAESYLSIDELNEYRRKYLSYLIAQEKGELAHFDSDVMNAILKDEILSEGQPEDLEDGITFGNRVADKIAMFGGSWTFILTFFFFILTWIGINVWLLNQKSFDPYPFILLNLILSCLAAIQAPIIMMSQNRQEQKDRIRAEHDYKINLKAELEIKLLSEKMDHLIVHQNKKLLEIQEIQTDFLEDLIKEIRKK